MPDTFRVVATKVDSSSREAIRTAGLRATASRIAVLRELKRAKRPVSHAEVVDALQGEHWDRATLYRNLVDLTNVGLARKVDLGDRVWRFDGTQGQAVHNAALHPHFVCTHCGEVACLPEVSISALAQDLPRALRRGDVEVHVRGVCDSCQP